jgi:murein DD-endopeptidase MepM/ murein hydrolase activator NlpD
MMPAAGLGASVALGAIDELSPAQRTPGTLVGTAEPAGQALPRQRSAAVSDRLSWPLRGAITGTFGEGRGGHSHAGIDIPKPAGTPIKAASGGRVIHAGDEAGYGNYVCIAHVKLSTCYAHLEKVRTKDGARVRRGQVIGTVGNTGNSGALHLHFEVRRGKKMYAPATNPKKYLPGA